MPDKWFISDTHFGHANILTFCPTRLELGTTIEAHDEALIARWNEVVMPGDRVYHLGDVAFGKRKADLGWVKRLNGHKFLLRGNHDTGHYGLWAEVFEELLPSVHPLPGLGDVVLSHAPLHPMCMAHRWKLNVHGHIHESEVYLQGRPWAPKPDPRYMNVSVERIGFRPILLEMVAERLRQNVAGPCAAALQRRFPPQAAGNSPAKRHKGPKGTMKQRRM